MIVQIVLLHQMAEFADRGLVWNGLPTQINTDKLRQGTGIVQGLFSGRIGEIEPVLDEVDSQYAFYSNGTEPSALRIGIEGLDGGTKLLPRYDGFHLMEKLFLAVFLTVFFKAAIREGVLTHSFSHVLMVGTYYE